MINQSVQLANTFGRWLFDQLWQMSVELAILAIVVAAAIALLRIRSAALRHLFWCLLLAKPVATFLVASPVSLYWFLNPPAETIQEIAPVVADREMRPAPVYPTGRRAYPSRAPVVHPLSLPPGPSPDRFGALALVWLFGAVALCLRLVFGFAYVSFLRRTARAVPPGRLLEVYDRTRQALSVRRIALGISSVSHGPVLAGILRPVILIPEALVDRFSVAQMMAVIAHEMAHARRRDNLVLLLQRLAEMLFFFHPVVWICGRMMRREAEAACDDVVLKHTGDSTSYADSLTCIAEMRFTLTQRLLVNTFAAAETNFRRRLRRILAGGVNAMSRRLTFAAALALILIGLLGLPTVAERSSEPKMTTPTMIDGVPPVKWGAGMDNTFAGALSSAMSVTGHPFGYTDLMGMSGLAFRTRWSNDQTKTRWCPSSAVGELPDEYEAIQRLTGWSLPTDIQLGVDKPDLDAVKQKIVASIDAGKPVAVYGTSLDMAVVYGYARGGDVLLLSDYSRRDEPFELDAKKIGPMQTYLGSWTQPPSRREAFVEALRTAVVNWKRSRHHGGLPDREYWYGDAALGAWIADLERFDSLPPEARAAFHRLNSWVAMSMKDARQAAVAYLKQHAPLLGSESSRALSSAASLYQQEVDRLDAAMKAGVLASAVGEWTASQRREQADALSACRELEAKAIAEIETILSTMNIDVEIPASAAALPESASVDFTPVFDPTTTEFGNGLAVVLNHLGVETDYTTLMGDLGLTFILQASDVAPIIDGAPDAGWWPLATDCLPALLPRAEAIIGRRLIFHTVDNAAYRRDPAVAYREAFELPLKRSISAGVPVLVNADDTWKVVTAYDKQNPPLTGFCASTRKPETPLERVSYPWILLTVGERVDRLSRPESDIRALQTAVSVARDLFDCPYGYRTGQQAYAIWATALRDTVHMGEPRWHANVVRHLSRYRTAAAGYLGAMAKRHEPEVARHLTSAAEQYREEVAALSKAEMGDVLKTARGRLRMAELVDRLAVIDAKAVEEIAGALTELGVEPPSVVEQTAGKREVLLQGYHHVGARITHAGGMMSCANHVGRQTSRAWFYGISGYAFAINVHETICPSGPTAWQANRCQTLAQNLGLKITAHEASRSAPDFRQKQETIWSAVRQAIDSGSPCMAWELDVPEWYVITGYDPDGYYLFDNYGKPGRIHYTKLGDTGIGWAAALSVAAAEPLDDRSAVREALLFALDHATGSHANEYWHTGLQAYDTWIAALEDSAMCVQDSTAGFGQGYNAVCWSECRSQAPAFLSEAKERIGDPELSPLFDRAIGHYTVVAGNLQTVAQLFPFTHNRNDYEARIREAGRRAKAVAALKRAQEAERSGLEVLAAIAGGLGAADARMPEVGKPELRLKQERESKAAAPGRPPVSGGSGRVERRVLEGLGSKKLFVSELSSMKACSEYLGIDMSTPWLYGATGHAFIINLAPNADVSGPTAWRHEMLHVLARNVGCKITGIVARKEDAGAGYREKQKEAWDFVRAAMDDGIPCYGWEIWPYIPDFQLITAYDATGYYYSYGDTQTGGPTPWDKPGEADIKIVQVYRVDRTDTKNEETIVREGLAAAVRHAAQPSNVSFPGFRTGPGAFEAWSDALEDGSALRDHHTYNLQVWQECRHQGVDFLKEVKERLPGRCDILIDEATAHYAVVRDKLAEALALHPDRQPDWDWGEKLKSADAAKLIRAAEDAEVKGIRVLSDIVVALGGDRIELSAQGDATSGNMIDTPRLVLRPFRAGDWPELQQLAVDWKSAPGPEFDKLPTAEEEVKGFAGHLAARAGQYFAMCRRTDNKIVGLLAINGVEGSGSMDLGHIILSTHQDDDLDREGLDAMVDRIFADPKIPSIITHNADHAPQLAPLKSLGFRQQGSGELALSREEWEQQGRRGRRMEASVRREGDRVWIEGVEGWHMGERGSSPHAAEATVMKALSEDITYTDLLGFSGLAFRLQVHKGLCPSSPHPFCGMECDEGSLAALPWAVRVIEVKEDDAEGVRAGREAVKASIDRGIPVVYGSEEFGLIVGYQKNGQEWIALHPLKKGGKETFVETNWPWGIGVFTERKEEQADRRELAIDAFKLAVGMTAAEDVDDYTLGRRAWDTWLAKLNELQTADEKTCAESMMGNSWIYTTLVEYRTQAVEYLRSVAGLFDEDVSRHLLAAADAYEEMATRILVDKDHCALDVAPTPWYLKEGQKWDAGWRAMQVERLGNARPLEEQALAEIGKALATLE